MYSLKKSAENSQKLLNFGIRKAQFGSVLKAKSSAESLELINDDDHITIDQNEDFSPTVDENQFEDQKDDSENFDFYARQNGQPIKVEDGANDGSF